MKRKGEGGEVGEEFGQAYPKFLACPLYAHIIQLLGVSTSYHYRCTAFIE